MKKKTMEQYPDKVIVSVWMDKTDRDKIAAAAKKEGRSLGNYIKVTMLKEAENADGGKIGGENEN